MNSDWKNALGALRGSMPDADVPVEPSDDPVAAAPLQTEPVKVCCEKRRGGKIATIIYGFTIPDTQIEALASEMKRSLGCGGSVRGGEILVQGDHLDAVKAFLHSKGLK